MLLGGCWQDEPSLLSAATVLHTSLSLLHDYPCHCRSAFWDGFPNNTQIFCVNKDKIKVMVGVYSWVCFIVDHIPDGEILPF